MVSIRGETKSGTEKDGGERAGRPRTRSDLRPARGELKYGLIPVAKLRAKRQSGGNPGGTEPRQLESIVRHVSLDLPRDLDHECDRQSD